MSDVSTLRLYLLRGTYLLIFTALGADIWPTLVREAAGRPLLNGVALCLLGAVSAIAALGLRYPLRMLPLLLFELLWKSIWLLAVGLPHLRAHQVDLPMHETLKACLMGWVIFPAVIPWGYVWRNFVTAPGDRWR